MFGCFGSVLALNAEGIGEYIGSYTWIASDVGGLSGLELTPKGDVFYAVSDRAILYAGTLERGASGRVTGVSLTTERPLLNEEGVFLSGRSVDSEGLALAEDGALYVSFEVEHRVAKLDANTGRAQTLPAHEDFETLQNNSSLEALAVSQNGLYVIPERSGELTRPFPIYHYTQDAWRTDASLPRSGEYLVVGSDIGPDNRLYVLERWFTGAQFASRVIRYDMDDFSRGELIFESAKGLHDNLEGLAVWQSERGTHLTMVSDNNFMFFQRTEFVDYLIAE